MGFRWLREAWDQVEVLSRLGLGLDYLGFRVEVFEV